MSLAAQFSAKFWGELFLESDCCGIEDGAEAKALSSACGTSTASEEQELQALPSELAGLSLAVDFQTDQLSLADDSQNFHPQGEPKPCLSRLPSLQPSLCTGASLHPQIFKSFLDLHSPITSSSLPVLPSAFPTSQGCLLLLKIPFPAAPPSHSLQCSKSCLP